MSNQDVVLLTSELVKRLANLEQRITDQHRVLIAKVNAIEQKIDDLVSEVSEANDESKILRERTINMERRLYYFNRKPTKFRPSHTEGHVLAPKKPIFGHFLGPFLFPPGVHKK